MQLSKEIFVKLKESVQFFSTMSDGEVLAILKLAVTENFEDGQVIFKENTRGDTMYIILNGTVRISKYLGNKKEEVLVKLTAGACFGEMAVIDQSPRAASATVEGGPAVLLVINENLLSEKNILLAYKLYKSFSIMLAGRLRDTNAKLQNAAAGAGDSSEQLKALLKKRLEKGASLQGANLRGADLSGVFLNGANLQNSILIGANMSEVKCKQTNFSQAKFVNSDLSSMTFDTTNMQKADFTGSKFENVEFISCDFRGANFTGAELPDAQGLDVSASGKSDSADESKESE
jgi:CRP-like cAMP-binding protein